MVMARVLLHGVTGSGKTEVQAIAPPHCNEESLPSSWYPDWSHTQLTDRFQPVLAIKSASITAPLSDGERYDTYANAHWELQVVIGTRSAVSACPKSV